MLFSYPHRSSTANQMSILQMYANLWAISTCSQGHDSVSTTSFSSYWEAMLCYHPDRSSERPYVDPQ
eukprot:6127841-Pyramimonas_sp.AAC.1